MREVPVTAVGAVAPEFVHQIALELRALFTLADVFAWARQASPPRQVEEIITQDEYTHDVLLPLTGSHFLAFDVT